MKETVVLSIISLLGTTIGTIGGIMTTARLTNYRLEQLEKKVTAHNNLIDRMYRVESRVTVIEDELKKEGF